MAAVDVRAVRIPWLVGELMMLAVVGDPLDHRALDRRRPQRAQQHTHRTASFEAAVGEQAVKAHRHAQSGQQIGDRQHDQVGPVQRATPRQPCRQTDKPHRHHRHHNIRDAVDHICHACAVIVGRVLFDRLACHILERLRRSGCAFIESR